MIFDTIAAIATPPGNGGIGVIRVSGLKAVETVEKYFTSTEALSLKDHPPRKLVYGNWREGGDSKVVDRLMAVRFQAPHSYTGEDVVEVHAHGGMFHLQSLLKDLLQAGARLAHAGEFTQRAFLNGKMDLTQAEAVVDLISAKADLSRSCAARQLAGSLKEKIEALRKEILEISAQVEAALDFPEEEDQLLPKNKLLKKTQDCLEGMKQLLATAKTGLRLRQGLRVVLCGRTNVGKSSLLNALLGSERAMVSQIKGTTRDFLEEPYQVQGFPVCLVDTAGLAEGAGPLDIEAVRRSREQVEKADLVLLVLNSSERPSKEDQELLAELSGKKDVPFLVLSNKSDLPTAWKIGDMAGLNAGENLFVSAKTGQGLEQLNEKILKTALQGGGSEIIEQTLLTQARHSDALRRAAENLTQVASTLAQGRLGPEFLSGDLRACLDALGEITGQVSRQEVLDEIFSKFCIGK